MSSPSSANWLNLVQTIAIVLTMIVSGLAYNQSVEQFRHSTESQIEGRAETAWLQYLDLATNNADLAGWFSFESSTAKKRSNMYSWYLDQMFFRFDSILRSSKDGVWRTRIREQLSQHQPMLCSGGSEFLNQFKLNTYTQELRDIVAQNLTTCPEKGRH